MDDNSEIGYRPTDDANNDIQGNDTANNSAVGSDLSGNNGMHV